MDTVKTKGRIRQMKYCINKEIYIPVMVCVDAYEYQTLSGRLYPVGNEIEQEKEQIFYSSTQLLLEMKALFELLLLVDSVLGKIRTKRISETHIMGWQ